MGSLTFVVTQNYFIGAVTVEGLPKTRSCSSATGERLEPGPRPAIHARKTGMLLTR